MQKTKWIVLVVFIASITQTIRLYLGRTPDMNIFYNINVTLEFLFLVFFFKDRFHNKYLNKLFIISAFIALIVGLFSFIQFDFKTKFFTAWLTTNNLAYTMWILLLVYDYYERDLHDFKHEKSLLYYLIGLFLYTSCTGLIFPLWEYLMATKDAYYISPWIIHDLFNSAMYVFIAIGLVVEYRNSKKVDA
ncbi:hypothetical protein [Kordia sp.]|uniref:hypothetical protein n=1 Tax=Kordia sp. TaxID=1965332 RepID=UPI003D2901A5